MASKRFVAGITILPLITLVSIAEATLTPPALFASPLFWSGFVTFFCLGAFVYMNVKFTAKVGGVAFAIVMFGLVALYSRGYSEAGDLAAGFPGLFVGIAVEGFYKLFYLTRWAYCPACQKKDWAIVKGRKLYCMRYEHPIEAAKAPLSLNGQD